MSVGRLDWAGSLFGVAFAVTITAWLAYRPLGPRYAVAAVALLALAERTAGRALRKQLGRRRSQRALPATEASFAVALRGRRVYYPRQCHYRSVPVRYAASPR